MNEEAAGASAGLNPTGDMLNAQLLAMLRGWSAYGYELVQRLEDAGFGITHKSSVYRALRHLEHMGLVCSMWDTSAAGPARRMYELTQAGLTFLDNWLALLDMHRALLGEFLEAATPLRQPRGSATTTARGESL